MNADLLAERALLWIVLLPLFGALINGVAGRFANKQLVGAVGVGSVALSFLLAVFAFYRLLGLQEEHGAGVRLVNHVYDWFSLYLGGSPLPISVKFAFDGLSGVMTLVVTGVGLLIHIYSLEYMEDDPGFARFFTYLNLFMASMLILVLGSSMPVMFVGWEGVGLCSYLLIGFWFDNTEYAAAGKKAFIVNRIGDFGVLVGMFVLFVAAGSLEISDINAQASSLGGSFFLGRMELGSVATVACLFLFLGCAGKSAQIPLYVWLPDAMAGPTPVSALIHAATMVTAGVYLCCRMSPLFMESPTAMATIAIVGALTALLAASIALVQNQLKRILAYSTVSQLGFMFAAVGSGAFAAGIFHVYTHAFFKACLFLGAGAVMHAVHAHGDADVRKLGGLAKKLPTVHWTFLVSCIAIAGVPFFSGWFSKDEILLGALSATTFFEESWIGWTVFAMLVAAATMTAFYMFRMYFLTFHGEYRSGPRADDAHDAHAEGHGYDPHPHAPGTRIAFVLQILGVGAIIAGFVNLEPVLHLIGSHGGNFWDEVVGGVVAGFEGPELGGLAYLPVAAGALAAAVGIGLAWNMYKQQGRMPVSEPTGFHRVLMNKWYVDELYELVILKPIKWLAVFAARVDQYFVDALLARATALSIRVAGWLFTRIQNGVVYAYGAVMVAGVALIAWWFTYPHAAIEGTVSRTSVEWVAGRGLGYQYRWDFDGDGEADTEWSADAHTSSHEYVPREWVGYALVAEGARPGEDEEIVLDNYGDAYVLGEDLLGRGWERDPEVGGAPPSARIDGDEVVVRPNGARARHRGMDVEDEVRLGPGDAIQLGAANVRVAAVVRARVEVKNAFDNIGQATAEIVLAPAPAGGAAPAGEPQAALAPGGAR